LLLPTKSEKEPGLIPMYWSSSVWLTNLAILTCHSNISVSDRGYWWTFCALAEVWLMVLGDADIHWGPICLVLMNGLMLFCCTGKDYLTGWTSCSGFASIFKADQNMLTLLGLSSFYVDLSQQCWKWLLSLGVDNIRLILQSLPFNHRRLVHGID
jgi:hypothetical protein